LIKAMGKRKLYCVPMPDARIMWHLTRYFPELYRSLVKYLYRRKLWIFNPDHTNLLLPEWHKSQGDSP